MFPGLHDEPQQNQIFLQVSVFRQFCAIWFRVEHEVVRNSGLRAYLMSPKKSETGRGLSKNFQRPYELLKLLRQPTTGFALLGAHQVGAVPEFPSTLCSTYLHCLILPLNLLCPANGLCNLVFTGDSSGSLIYDIIQLNVLHKDHHPFFSWYDTREIQLGSK
ncbi:hypothetical protein CSKR_111396 [Clonorchis sinensis]|uniref:Uncharacterized protein n=1 Tax=Clonorchis sinensis TaxID=79923 RepID=A0A419PZX8_CLOSI|nr:hypothetical protein CSKR_111396 [Clonorchis sinensis]